MARLNIDYAALCTDPRFRKLTRLCGEDSAIAKCVRAFSIAQRYWAEDQQLVPEDVWKLEDCDELVDAGLAIRDESGGVYVRGSEKYFAWLLKRRRAAQKGGIANKDRLASQKLRRGKPKASVRLAEQASPLVIDTVIDTVTDRYISPSNEGESISPPAKAGPPSPVLKLAESWNQVASPPLPAVDLARFKSTSKRYLAAKRRLAEEPDLGYWLVVIQRIRDSDFCTGHNDRGWKADFEWLTKPDTHTKVLEGKYDNTSQRREDPERVAFEKRREEARKRREAEEEAYREEARRVREENLRLEAERRAKGGVPYAQ